MERAKRPSEDNGRSRTLRIAIVTENFLPKVRSDLVDFVYLEADIVHFRWMESRERSRDCLSISQGRGTLLS